MEDNKNNISNILEKVFFLFKLIFYIFFIFLLQIKLASALQICSVFPNFLIISVISAAILINLETSLFLAVSFAILQSIFLNDSFFDFSLIISAFLTYYLAPKLKINEKIVAVLLCVFISFCVEIINMWYFSLLKESNILFQDYWIPLFLPLINGLFTLPCFILFSKIFRNENSNKRKKRYYYM